MDKSAVIGADIKDKMKLSLKALKPLYLTNTCLNHLNVRWKSYPQVLNIAPKGTHIYIMITNKARAEQMIERGIVTLLSVINILSLDALPERVAVLFLSR